MKRLVLFCFIIITHGRAEGQRTNSTENLVLITLDGLRWQELFTGADSLLVANKNYVKDPIRLMDQFWSDDLKERRMLLMPFIWTTIARDGQLYGNRRFQNNVNCRNQMWFSYPGYNEILCGFSDDDRIKTNNKIDNPNVTVLEFLNRQPSLRGKVCAFGSWDVFPFIINETRSGIPVNAGFETADGRNLTDRERFLNELQPQVPSPWSSVRLDAFTHHYALEFMKKNHPRVIFIAYGETDDFAHDGKYDAYLQSAHQTDKFIAEIWEWIQTSDQYKDKTTLLITTDHGRGTFPLESWRNHGKDVSGADQIWFAAIGPDTSAEGELTRPGQLYQSQLAKTMARFLNIEYRNERPVGDIIEGMVSKR